MLLRWLLPLYIYTYIYICCMRRLEEVCRAPNGYPLQRASSSGSVWSMGSDATEARALKWRSTAASHTLFNARRRANMGCDMFAPMAR